MTAEVDARRIVARAVVTGCVATVILHAGLGLTAEAEGKAPLRPLNATSHWLNGDAAGLSGNADLAHTSVGFATNLACCLFWALPFEVWQATRPPRSDAALVRGTVAMSAVAALIDYGATPKRFTPGWELVLSRNGMVGAYAALALGLATGSSMARSRG